MAFDWILAFKIVLFPTCHRCPGSPGGQSCCRLSRPDWSHPWPRTSDFWRKIFHSNKKNTSYLYGQVSFIKVYKVLRSKTGSGTWGRSWLSFSTSVFCKIWRESARKEVGGQTEPHSWPRTYYWQVKTLSMYVVSFSLFLKWGWKHLINNYINICLGC